jgi:hypothetical protein
MFVQHNSERSLLYVTKISFAAPQLCLGPAEAICLDHRRSLMGDDMIEETPMPSLTSRATATAAAAAIALGTIGLTSARAADFSPPPTYSPPPEYPPPTAYAPPPAYVPPPVYAPAPVEVVPVFPPTVYVAPPVAYPYLYRRYSYAPIYHERFGSHARFWYRH